MVIKLVELIPKTNHGKNAVHNYGKIWQIIREGNPKCFDGEKSFLLISLSNTKDNMRWVKCENDKNFLIQENSHVEPETTSCP